MTQADPLNITPAEWEIMRVVWAQGQATSQAIQEILNEEMDWKQSTTKTLINRLKNKKLLQTQKQGRSYIYKPTLSEEECMRSKINTLFNDICNLKVGQYISYLIEDHELSQDDLKQIEKIVKQKKNHSPAQLVCDCLPGQCRCLTCPSQEVE